MVSSALIKRTAKYCSLASIVSVFTFYVLYTGQSHADYVRDPKVKCSHSKREMEQLLNLSHEVHTILNSLKIDHWLMYGSIFGAMRVKGPLPWDYDVDIGIRGEQYIMLEKSEFFRPFEQVGMIVEDHVNRNGLIQMKRHGWNLGVDLFTFYDYGGNMKRPGWAPRLLFINYALHHTFPSRLVKSPMPITKFGCFNISVPREGKEILKYLYRFDWWKEVKPLNCH